VALTWLRCDVAVIARYDTDGIASYDMAVIPRCDINGTARYDTAVIARYDVRVAASYDTHVTVAAASMMFVVDSDPESSTTNQQHY